MIRNNEVLHLSTNKMSFKHIIVRFMQKYIYIDLRHRYFQSDGIQQMVDAMRSITVILVHYMQFKFLHIYIYFFPIKQTSKILHIDANCIGLHGFRYFIDEFKNNTVSFKQNSKYNFQIPLQTRVGLYLHGTIFAEHFFSGL